LKYLYNPATDEFESLTPTLRDRFALGGRVNFDKGSPFPITDDVLEQIDNLIKNTNLNLKEIGKKIKYGTETRGMTIDTPVMKKYIEKYGKPSDARLQTKGVPLSSDKGLGKKIVTAYDKQIKNFGKPDISKIAREVYGPGVKDLDSARAQVRSVLGRFRDYKGEANIPIDKKDLTAEQIKSKARAKKLKLVDNPTIAKFMAGPQGSGFQYHHMDATKTSPVTLNNVVYLPSEVNNYIQSYEGPISQRKKEIIKLNKNKPKGYKKQIDAKLNQIRNTIAKADMDLDKAGYSAYKGVIEVDTIDVNGKPLKIGGGSALRLGEGLAEELGLDSNKPLKQFTSEEQIKLNQAKKALIKKSSINKPKMTFGKAAKGLGKALLRKSPPALMALGINEAAKASEFTKDPRDLITAFNTSADVAAKQKAMREDKTGKLLQEEMANLPEITTDDQVAGALLDSFPDQSFLQYQSAVDDGFQGSFEEYLQQQSMKMASGGRVGFKDGTSNPIFDQVIASLDNTDLINNLEEENKQTLAEQIYGEEGDRTMMQRFNTMFADPRAIPYYASKFVEGATRIPEYMVRTVPALGQAAGDIIQGREEGKMDRFIKAISPSITDAAQEKIGLTGLIEEQEKNRTTPQQFTGGVLELAGELPGPATPLFLLKAPKYIKELRNLAGGTQAAKELERKIEERVAVDQGRRDFNKVLAVGGVMGLLKSLGLDKLIGAGAKVAQKAAPEIITSGGTPKYFFDFVDLIKKKGKDVSEEASTVAREKVYDYNGYTLYEKLDTGEIRIGKETEGGGSYYIGDGEFENIDGIIKKEEVTYTPKETIIGKDGKPVEVKDTYDEATLKPDRDGNEGDFEAGLESIDEILELLSKDGKTYSKEELLKMGIDADALKNYSTGAGTIPKDMIGKSNPFKTKKAGGGIIKLAGDDSGPPPKSGPTPHGLPYVAKNVRPIKERK
jgi:hypothetical protein